MVRKLKIVGPAIVILMLLNFDAIVGLLSYLLLFSD